jgi:hypothetical protein
MSELERETDSAATSRKAQQDTQSALDAELQREVKEGADTIGDMRENRNLSGSASWETLSSDSNRGTDRPEVF